MQRSANIARRTLYGRAFGTVSKAHRVLTFDGDGSSPEAMAATKQVLRQTNCTFDFVDMPFGLEYAQRTGGNMINEEHLQAIEEIKTCLKGSITNPTSQGVGNFTELRGRKFTSGNQAMRKLFTLYANVRPARHIPHPAGKGFPGTDLVTVRENTEDMYTGEESWVGDDEVVAIKRTTRKACRRIAEFAFKYAKKQNRRLVTAVHKANVCKVGDGLFLECCREVAKANPEIEYSEQLADSLLTLMVLDPTKFDVLLCPNLFGDMVSDLAGGLIGSLGLCGSGMFGEGGIAVFEPSHGSAPDIAGKGLVNPVSQILAAKMMLDHLGEVEEASRVERAVEVVVKSGIVTPDLGGTSSTMDMADAISRELNK